MAEGKVSPGAMGKWQTGTGLKHLHYLLMDLRRFGILVAVLSTFGNGKPRQHLKQLSSLI